MFVEEEEDYMSDTFVHMCSDVRPTLIHRRSEKRQLVVEKKQKEHINRQKELKKRSSTYATNEALHEALKKPLQIDNKGFQILTKLGYKAGQALGKSSSLTYKSEQSFVTEPIPIVLKNNRHGLGLEQTVQDLNKNRSQIHCENVEENNVNSKTCIEEFRNRVTQKLDERSISFTLRKCRIICENLDREALISKPEMQWFWSGHDEESSEIINDDITEQYDDNEKLRLLVAYLRDSHNFCYWCGIHFKNQNDLLQDCPGSAKDDH